METSEIGLAWLGLDWRGGVWESGCECNFPWGTHANNDEAAPIVLDVIWGNGVEGGRG